MYFTKSVVTAADPAVDPSTTGAWDVHYQVDGVNGEYDTGTVAIPALTVNPSSTRLNFNSSGQFLAQSPAGNVSINLDNVMQANGKKNSASLSFAIDFSDSTQFGAKFSVNELTQDGYTPGNLAGLSIGPDGVIQGNYSNGQTKNLAQIVLANFTNPNGLMSVGNNAWMETAARPAQGRHARHRHAGCSAIRRGGRVERRPDG